MASMLPKVSIIIPYKEDRGYLQEAIESVRKQSYKNIELITSQSDGNVAYNINEGVKIATGEYIKYLCDDDILPPDSILYSVNSIRGFDFIHGHAINFFPNGRQQVHKAKHGWSVDEFVQLNRIHGGSLMYKRELFDKFGGFDESLNCAEEYDFNMKILRGGAKLGFCNQILYKYRRHDKQKSLGRGIDQIERGKRIKAIQDRYR